MQYVGYSDAVIRCTTELPHQRQQNVAADLMCHFVVFSFSIFRVAILRGDYFPGLVDPFPA